MSDEADVACGLGFVVLPIWISAITSTLLSLPVHHRGGVTSESVKTQIRHTELNSVTNDNGGYCGKFKHHTTAMLIVEFYL